MRLPSTSSRQLLRSILITGVLVLALNNISRALAQNETSVPTNDPTASPAILVQPSQSPSDAATVLNVTDSNTTTESTTAALNVTDSNTTAEPTATTPSMVAVIAPDSAATTMSPTVTSSTAGDIVTSPPPSPTPSEARSNIFDNDRSDQSIYNIIKDGSAYSTLGIVLDAAGLSSILSSPENYTLFAPNNAALLKFDVDMFSKYLEAQWLFHLQDMLLYHALQSTVYVSDIVDGMEVEAANGENLTLSLNPLRINDDMAEIDMNATDMVGNNGVMHGINDVLLPSSAQLTVIDRAIADPNLSVLVDLVQTAGLVDEFSALPGPVTLLAPTNSAFDKLPNGTIEELKLPTNVDMLSRVLKYHVIVNKIYHSSQFEDEELLTDVGAVTFNVTGGEPTVNDAIIIGTDILASNGIVHVVDTVLVPPEPEPTDPPSVMPSQIPTEADPTSPPTVNVTTEPVDPPSSDAYGMKQRRLVGSATVVVAMLHLLLLSVW